MKNSQLQFRASDEDRELIRSMAQARGFSGYGEYLLSLVRADAKEGNVTEHFTPEDIAILKKLIKREQGR